MFNIKRLIFLPLLLLIPSVWNWLQDISRSFFGTLHNLIRFFEHNLIVALILIVIVTLLCIRNKQKGENMFGNLFINNKQEILERLQRHGLPIYDEDTWWVSFPERAEGEILKMQRFSNSILSADGDSLVWHFETTTNFGNTYFKTIVADSGFPFKCHYSTYCCQSKE